MTVGRRPARNSPYSPGGRAYKSSKVTEMRDHFGRPITIGCTIQVDCIDASRGAQQWMHRGTVVGFARTRVKIEFSSAAGIYNVGPECMAVIQ